MVDQTNIFEGSAQTQDQVGEQTVNAVPESITELVGEGKKYSDVNKALESIPHAQTHIQQLEQELAETRAKLDAQASVEDTLKRFSEQKAQETPTSQPVDLNEVVNKVRQTLSADKQAEKDAANQRDVATTLSKQYGDKAKEVFEAKARELGMSIQDMDNLAAKSPQAVYQMFGTTADMKSQAAMKTSVNSQAFESTQQPRQETIEGVMFGASSEQVLEAFRKAKQSIQS